ncbi:hypothetical protein JCM10207_002553 [Rhodosporidiobolus poonsookiae]
MRGLLALLVGSLLVAFTTLTLDIFSTIRQDWIRWETPAIVPVHLTTTYGLFQRCDTSSYLPGVTTCRKFPQRGLDCGKKAARVPAVAEATALSDDDGNDEEEGWGFCENWAVAGYAHQLSLIFGLANLVSLVLTLIGTAIVGRGFRTEKLRSGWKLVAGFMAMQALFMIVSSSIVAYERNNEQARFGPGAHLARAWTMTTVAYALNLVIVVALLFVRATGKLRIVPGEEGYESIGGRA